MLEKLIAVQDKWDALWEGGLPDPKAAKEVGDDLLAFLIALITTPLPPPLDLPPDESAPSLDERFGSGRSDRD